MEDFSVGLCDDKRNASDDLISKLPDALISEILLYLPTKEAVRTNVLSNRWKSVWFSIPGLDLDSSSQFPNYNAFVSFVDRFIDFYREENSCLQKLKLSVRKDKNDESCVTRWIDFVATPKLKYLDIKCGHVEREYLPLEVMPLSLYKCDTLAYLRLYQVSLCSFKSVSLLCLKFMRLERNIYANEAALELFISSCPVLEDLSIVRRANDNVMFLRVRSQTLINLSVGFGNKVDYFDRTIWGLLIDAPRLKHLIFNNEQSKRKILCNLGSLAKVTFERAGLLPKFEMDYNFLTSISRVRDMIISGYMTLRFIDSYMKVEPLPQFCNLLSSLEVKYVACALNRLPTFLEICPNLKSIVLELLCCSLREQITSPVPRCLLSSLEFVEIKRIFDADTTDSEVARYFLENSAILKKLVLRRRSSTIEEDSVALRHLLVLPRRSSMCQIVVC